MNEVHIEEILSFHPYLIDASLEGLIPTRQQRKGRYRYDLGFSTKQGLTIVELKKSELKPCDISQLGAYCRAWGRTKREKLAPKHYLIGKKPTDTAPLDKALTRFSWDIAIRYIGTDIPSSLAMVGDRYRPYDEGFAKRVIHLKV